MVEYKKSKIDEVMKKPTNLEVIRKEQKMTRKQLSLKSGIRVRTIESYEQGLRDIKRGKIETIIKLSNGLNCKIEDII